MSPLKRNTLNQRASRARKRDYVTDLEARVRQFETEGIKIHTDIQTAARAVNEENLLLKQLLASRFDVHEDEWKTYLMIERLKREKVELEALGPHAPDKIREKISYTDARIANLRMMEHHLQLQRRTTVVEKTKDKSQREITPSDAALQSDADARGTGTPQGTGTIETDADTTSNTVHPQRDRRLQPSRTYPPSPALLQADNIVMASSSPDCSPAPTHVSQRVHDVPADAVPVCLSHANSTPCEQAAAIIASMRGAAESQEIWPELGCSSMKSCRVDNMRLFRMLDQS